MHYGDSSVISNSQLISNFKLILELCIIYAKSQEKKLQNQQFILFCYQMQYYLLMMTDNQRIQWGWL
ncbi:unnamed protein product [Paramecium octaurelia]|uniref:Uncharacterized protein n=1 Tax=Paramecium octaurelia TaxID=43137 RepID=A0A8S1X1I5_PAROT|nr:unnamed protein product [Paramecium octaurelia]